MNSLFTQYGRQAVRRVGTMRVVTAIFLTLLGLAGCSVLDLRDDDVVVKERAQARWDALVSGDYATAYRYLSPSSRAVLTQEAYAASLRKGFWKSAKVNSVTCGGKDNCETHATIEYEIQGRRTKTPLNETWIREGSEWWYLQR